MEALGLGTIQYLKGINMTQGEENKILKYGIITPDNQNYLIVFDSDAIGSELTINIFDSSGIGENIIASGGSVSSQRGKVEINQNSTAIKYPDNVILGGDFDNETYYLYDNVNEYEAVQANNNISVGINSNYIKYETSVSAPYLGAYLTQAIDKLKINTGYSITGACSSFNLTAGTNYFFGSLFNTTPTTSSSDSRSIKILKGGRIKKASFNWARSGGSYSTSTAPSIGILKNGTYHFLFSESAFASANGGNSSYDISTIINLADGDEIIFALYPQYSSGTLPTNISLQVNLFIDPIYV